MQTIISWFQLPRIRRILIVFLLQFTLLITNVSLLNSKALADTSPEATARKAERGADNIDQGKEEAKQIFQGAESAKTIDNARENAKEKLNSLANEVREDQKPEESLPSNQRFYLKDL